jgi:uncharacterized delta-60 repeat protein
MRDNAALSRQTAAFVFLPLCCSMDFLKMTGWIASMVRPVLVGLLILMNVWGGRAHAQTPGGVDSTFYANVSGTSVKTAVPQADGKIVIGGIFSSIGSSYPSINRNNIARLNSSGTADASFDPGSGMNSTVDCLAIQPDGKIVAGGLFTSVNGRACSYLCRLNTDGSVDPSFTTGVVSGEVLGVAVQPDGKIIAVGSFSTVNGSSQSRITRLNADGTLDGTFSPLTATNGQINSVALQPDGNIVIGGLFTTVNGSTANRIARLTSSGVTDSLFNPGTGANAPVSCVALQADGKILLSGGFGTINGTARAGLARLNANGGLESTSTFNPGGGAGGTIYSIAVQTDGKIICVGSFSTFNGSFRNGMVRLGSNGAVDNTFSGSANGAVYSVALQGDGKVLLGENGFISSSLVVRLNNNTATTTVAATDPSTVQWLRGGACGEVSSATFELSVDNGTTWTALGSATRGGSGWQLAGLSLPASGHLRARGLATAGLGNGGTGWIEQTTPFGGASSAPVANTLTATATVAATGALYPPVTYGAILYGSVNALGKTTTVTFQYGPSNAYGLSITPVQSPVGGSTLSPVSASITGLQPGLTYHYRVQAVSAASTTYGSDATFTTPSNVATLSGLEVAGATLSPTFSTGNSQYSTYNAVLPADATTATINVAATDPNSTISVNGTTLPGGATSAVVNVVPGNNSVPIVVTAQDGLTTTSYSLVVTVTTAPTAATAHTNVSDTYAVLKASLMAMDTTASVTFEYGLDTNYGMTVSGLAAKGGLTSILGSTVTGLVPGATYHYRVIVTNSQGTATSSDATFTTFLAPPPGSIDNRFNASMSFVYATVTQPDGRIIACGFFSQANGTSAGNLARFNPDGSLDTSFHVATNNSVECVTVQGDGRILIGGYFTQVNGATVKNLARLNSDGSLDTSFTASPNNEVASLTVQSDGKILIGGFFSSVGATSQKYLARLNSDGSVDTSFAPSLDVWVNSVTLQDDGKIVVGGWFGQVNGTTHDNIVRLNTDGTTDTVFNAGTDVPVDCVMVQPDGSIVLTGWFHKVNGTTRNNVARVGPDGTLDANFDPNADGRVYTAALQTDGKILLGGFFSHIGGISRSYIARFSADGTMDTVFDPDPTGPVYSVTPQANGEVLIGGSFSTLFGQKHNGLGLVLNDPASQALSLPDLTQIQWARSGAGPEVTGVSFDLSVDGGVTWGALGGATRISAGWQMTGLNLPSAGLIRARGRTSSGEDGGSSSLIEQRLSYPPGPQIFLQQPAGVALTSGASTIDFGGLLPGSSATATFTVLNTGDTDLTNLAITIDGVNAADFAVTQAPASPVSGGGSSTTFTVQFTPAATGPRNAALHLASNVAGSNNPFNVGLAGTGLTHQENWRLIQFGTTVATGNAADTADPDGDGVPNLIEFAVGSDPKHGNSSPGQIVHIGGNLEFTYQRADAALLDGVSFIVEWSDTLQQNAWSSIGVSEIVLSDDGTLQQVKAVVPDGGNGSRFVRLRVTH